MLGVGHAATGRNCSAGPILRGCGRSTACSANDQRIPACGRCAVGALALAFVELLQRGTMVLGAARLRRSRRGGRESSPTLEAMFGLLFSVGALVLVHNLFAGASPAGRAAAALAGGRARRRCGFYDLNYLHRHLPRQKGVPGHARRLARRRAAGDGRAARPRHGQGRRRAAPAPVALVRVPVVLAPGDRRLSDGDGRASRSGSPIPAATSGAWCSSRSWCLRAPRRWCSCPHGGCAAGYG